MDRFQKSLLQWVRTVKNPHGPYNGSWSTDPDSAFWTEKRIQIKDCPRAFVPVFIRGKRKRVKKKTKEEGRRNKKKNQPKKGVKGEKMRLLTHNMLSSNIKGVTNGFPLRLQVEKSVEKEVDLNPDFLKNIFPKIEWKALVDASRALGYPELPDEAEPSMLDSHDFLKKFHHALLELHVEEGALICPETGRNFPISKGIPNMLLHEDEV